MAKTIYVLNSPQVRQNARQAVSDAQEGMIVEIREPIRSSSENRLLHALIGEISEKIEWAGKKRDPEVWKRLLVAAWCRASGEPIEILPSLDDHGIDIMPRRTSGLSKKECADLIEYAYSWAAENGIGDGLL